MHAGSSLQKHVLALIGSLQEIILANMLTTGMKVVS